MDARGIVPQVGNTTVAAEEKASVPDDRAAAGRCETSRSEPRARLDPATKHNTVRSRLPCSHAPSGQPTARPPFPLFALGPKAAVEIGAIAPPTRAFPRGGFATSNTRELVLVSNRPARRALLGRIARASQDNTAYD